MVFHAFKLKIKPEGMRTFDFYNNQSELESIAEITLNILNRKGIELPSKVKKFILQLDDDTFIERFPKAISQLTNYKINAQCMLSDLAKDGLVETLLHI